MPAFLRRKLYGHRQLRAGNTDDPAWRAIYEKRCKEAGFSAYFDYSWQWAYKKKFEDAGLTALLAAALTRA